MRQPQRIRRAAALVTVLVAACSPTVDVSVAPPSPTPSSPDQSRTASPLPLVAPSVEATLGGRVKRAAPMVRARVGFDAVLLGDGTVLAVGGDASCLPGPAMVGSDTAERYDPIADHWNEAQGLSEPRRTVATVALADGRAMVIGGVDAVGQPSASTEIFDPGTDRWTDGPSLDAARSNPEAARLAEGEVVVASPASGGRNFRRTAVGLLEPRASAWVRTTPIGAMNGLTLHPLADGRVMATSPASYGYVVLWDPAGDRSWQTIEGPTIVRQARYAPLHGRDVLAFGYEGITLQGPATFRASERMERLDISTNTWHEVASMDVPRVDPIVAVLPDDRVLFAGGTVYEGGDAQVTATSEIYDATTDVWTAGPDLLEPRNDGMAIVLADGSVLIFGGEADVNPDGSVFGCPEPMTSTERFFLDA